MRPYRPLRSSSVTTSVAREDWLLHHIRAYERSRSNPHKVMPVAVSRSVLPMIPGSPARRPTRRLVGLFGCSDRACWASRSCRCSIATAHGVAVSGNVGVTRCLASIRHRAPMSLAGDHGDIGCPSDRRMNPGGADPHQRHLTRRHRQRRSRVRSLREAATTRCPPRRWAPPGTDLGKPCNGAPAERTQPEECHRPPRHHRAQNTTDSSVTPQHRRS